MHSKKNASKYAIPVRINSDDNVYMPATVFSESKKSLERSQFFSFKNKTENRYTRVQTAYVTVHAQEQ